MRMEDFITNDLNLAVTLKLHGCQLKELVPMKKDHNKANFHFDDTVELREITEDYWENRATVDPIAFSETIKQLKNRIFSLDKS